jgi:outer membrane protein OmpA-like peptidoglycan-associated protein
MKRTILLLLILFIGTATSFAQTSSQSSELDAVISALERNESVKDRKIMLRNIQFETGTSRLTSIDKYFLDTLSTFLTKMPTIILEISGHTDNTGRVQTNNKLSQDRANSVRLYLISKGISTKQVYAMGYGSYQPIADNKTVEGRTLNRRVELQIKGMTNDVYKIHTKDGRSLSATYLVVSSDGKSITYRENDRSPISKISSGEVDYIEYPDGSRRKAGLVVVEEKKEEEQTPAEPAKVEDVTQQTRPGRWLSLKFPKFSRFSVVANLGVAPLTVTKTQLAFAYVDESPSQDNIQEVIDLKKANIGVVGQIGLEWESTSKWLQRAQYQFGKSKQSGMSSILFGIGKGFGDESRFVASVDLTIGSSYLKLGDIYQNDIFIQVNGKKFYSDKVAIKFRNYFVGLTPQLSYSFPLGDALDLRITGGYSYAFHTKSGLVFKGNDKGGKKVKAKERLSAENVGFYIEGERKTNPKIFGLNGPYGNIAILYHLYKR